MVPRGARGENGHYWDYMSLFQPNLKKYKEWGRITTPPTKQQKKLNPK